MPKSRRTPQSSLNRALVWVDEAPLRDKHAREIRKLEDEREKLAADLSRFENVDKPAFQSWLHLSFARQIQKIEQLREEFLKLESLVREVQMEAVYTGLDEAECLPRVRRRRKKALAEAKRRKLREQSDEGPRFSDFFRDDAGDSSESPGRGSGREGRSTPPPPSPEIFEVKELYRWLVKRLHPDATGMTTERKALWLETQQAYRHGDVKKLQELKARLEMKQDRSGEEKQSIWGLKTLIKKLRGALGPLKKEVRRCQGELAWNFSQRKDRSVQKKSLGKEFRKGTEELESQVELLRFYIRLWEAR